MASKFGNYFHDTVIFLSFICKILLECKKLGINVLGMDRILLNESNT